MIVPIIIAILALSGGASFVAETSFPGDPLYIVKTSVNEKVMTMLNTNNPEDHIKWETTLATRRLDEAAELQLRGTLTADMAAKLNAEFAAHANEAVTAAQKLGSSAEEVSAVSVRAK